MMPARRRNLGAGAALSVLQQILPVLAVGALSIVLARTIGPAGSGRFALLATLAGTIALVASLGLTAGITYEVSRSRWSVERAFRTSYLVGSILGIAGLAGGFGFYALTRDTVFSGIGTGIAVIALVSVPPILAYQFAYSIMLGRERYEKYAALSACYGGTLFLVGAGLAVPLGLTGAVIGLPAAAFSGAVLGAAFLTREPRRDRLGGASGSFGRALRFGLQSWGANLLQQINYRFDVLILGGFGTARDVGVYSVALTLTSVAWVLPQALQAVLLPRVASLDESRIIGEITVEESDAALAKAARHSVILTLPAAVLIGGLLIAVPLLYGGKFAETTSLGFILLPGVLLLGIGKVLSSAIAGRGFPRYTLFIGMLSVPLTLTLYFSLIPLLHEWGAAVASSVSYAGTALLTLVFFRRVTRIRLEEAFVPRSEDIADYEGLTRLARSWRPAR
jgi:O-antigen/teichoic acid export membrane protein